MYTLFRKMDQFLYLAQHQMIFTTEQHYTVIYGLLNCTIFDDLE